MRMYWVKRGRAAVLLLVLCGSAGALGQAPQESSQDNKAQEPAKPAAAQPGPKYLNLRWNEDFSYLDGADGTYQDDFFDPIKNIHLDDDWRLSIGGEFRFRWESETNKSFGVLDPTTDSFFLQRYLLHADFKYRDSFRVFVQGAAMFEDDRNLPRRGIDSNHWDLQQLFADLKIGGDDLPLTLRVGRQELQYGNERLVSPFEWGNIRRRFDGVKLFATGDTWDVDVWWVRPVPVQRHQHDRYDEDFDFWGAYATYKGMENHGLDLYLLVVDDDGVPMNPNLKVGDRDIYTLGFRFWGNDGPWDYETELAGQWGNWAGDTVQAWSWAVDGGYTFSEYECIPRIGAGFDMATGDDDPFDSTVGTFDQLFPLSHKYFGFLDLIGRKNINAFNLNVSAWAVPEKVRATATYHAFWLNTEDDALYNAGGAATRRDFTGHSGREVGQELDLTVHWKLDAHSALLFGYSHLWDGGFIIDTGPSEDADLFYIQYAYKF